MEPPLQYSYTDLIFISQYLWEPTFCLTAIKIFKQFSKILILMPNTVIVDNYFVKFRSDVNTEFYPGGAKSSGWQNCISENWVRDWIWILRVTLLSLHFPTLSCYTQLKTHKLTPLQVTHSLNSTLSQDLTKEQDAVFRGSDCIDSYFDALIALWVLTDSWLIPDWLLEDLSQNDEDWLL